MHLFWFLWDNVQLVDTNTPKNPTSKKDARRPQSQVAPQETPAENSKVADDTLANVASIAPDVSTGVPPKS